MLRQFPNLLIRSVAEASGLSRLDLRELQVEITTRCNLRCVMCPRETLGWGSLPSADMPLERFGVILSKIPAVASILISVMGEPLLNRRVVDFVRMARDKGAVGLITNGLLLTQPLAKSLFEAGLSRLMVSIDSPVREKYESIRRGARFEILVNNVRDLVGLWTSQYRERFLGVSAVVDANTLSDAESMIVSCSVWGIPNLCLLINSDPAAQRIAAVQPNYRLLLSQLCTQAKMLGVDISFGGGKFGDEQTDGLATCRRPWAGLFIECNGDVSPCCIHEKKQKDYVGNIFDDSFSKIWNGKQMRGFRRALAGRVKPPMCVGCSHLYGG